MYTIGQVSEMFDLPISTLRYYDKEGFFPNVIKLRNDGFEGNTKNVLLFFFENLNFLLTYRLKCVAYYHF